MATKSCPDCGRSISPMAYNCPQCRRLTEHGLTNFSIRIILLGFLAFNLFRYQPF